MRVQGGAHPAWVEMFTMVSPVQGGNEWEGLIPCWNGIGPLFQSIPGTAIMSGTPNVEKKKGLSMSGGIPCLHLLSPCSPGFGQALSYSQLGQPVRLGHHIRLELINMD